MTNKLLRIRLARAGVRNNPFYYVHVAEVGRPRDGKYIERLGKYEPRPDLKSDGAKHISLNFERVKFWLAYGAEPSPRVAWLLGKANLLPSIPRGPAAMKVSDHATDTQDSKSTRS